MEISGHKINNWWLIGGGAGVVLVYFVYKRSQNATAATGAGSGGTDPATGLPYSEDSTIDPATGMTYLAEAQEYGSVQAAENAVSSGSTYGSAGGGYVGTAGNPTSNVGPGTASTSFATNAAWAQAVTSGLVGLGYNAQDVAAALGLFFAQQPLGTASDGVSYASIVQAAEAEFGPPPQGTYSIVPEAPGPGSGRLAAGPTGVAVSTKSSKHVTLTWKPVNGATGYTVEVKHGGANGLQLLAPTIVTSPTIAIGPVESGSATALIWPTDSADPGGPTSNQPHTEFSFVVP